MTPSSVRLGFLGADFSHVAGLLLEDVVGVEIVTRRCHQVDVSIVCLRDTRYTRRMVGERTAETGKIIGAVAIDDLSRMKQVGSGS